MAEVGAVYDATPVIRTVADVLPANDAERRLPSPGRWPTLDSLA